MNGARHTGGQERSIVDDIRDLDPATWPYAGQVPPAQAALQEARRRQAQPGPARVPTFTPTGPQVRLAVTAAQQQAPQAPPLQVHEHPAGTFTGLSPWQQWARRAQVRPFPAPGRDTPFYNAVLRDRAGMMAAAPAAAEPFTLAPPARESWRACQALMMLPLPGCDYDAYLQAVGRLTGTRGAGRQAVAALPPSGADYSGRERRQVLADAIGTAAGRARPGRAKAYARLREAVLAAWDYETAEHLVRNADRAGLVSRAEIEGTAR